MDYKRYQDCTEDVPKNVKAERKYKIKTEIASKSITIEYLKFKADFNMAVDFGTTDTIGTVATCAC